jgi:hypothetical protein
MTAGLPGVGIGGMFYLVSALLMPFRSLVATFAGRDARWPLARRQALIALGVLGSIWATGWVIGWLIALFSPDPVAGTLSTSVLGVPVRNAVRTAALLGSIGTLTLVLLSVQVLRVLLPARPTPRAISQASADETSSAA